MIPVTKSFLPPMEEYNAFVKRVWQNQWLTNRGELVLELEEKLKGYLTTDNILITNNGTVPIQIALKLLGNHAEIITTPFSYVATTASIVWEYCTPVFVDIEPTYLSIDETKIEAAITANTTCILATHVFGNPCNVLAIEAIATKHNLMVIYDAAHCFGVQYNGKSIFDYGDISTCSFHATKVFHTAEGGAIFCKNKELMHKIYYSHNFGHNGPLDFYGLGINAKISEIQAAMGLAVFPYLDQIIKDRKNVVDIYNDHINFTSIRTLTIREHTQWNYSYYPIIFENEEMLLKVIKALNEKNIMPRRYFSPSLNKIEYTKGATMPVAEAVASSIICLPLFTTLTEREVLQIAEIINQTIYN